MFTPWRIGLIAAVVAAGMLVTELVWRPVFTVPLGDFGLPLWTLVALYSALHFTLWFGTRRRLTLTDDELAAWGEKLERATPSILEAWKAHATVGEIAETIERSFGIPRDVTLRYIIALGEHVREAPGSQNEPR